MAILGLVGTLAACADLLFITRSISKLIRFVTEAVGDFSEGDFTLAGMDHAALIRYRVRSDEIGDATRAFERLAESIREKAGSLQIAAKQVADGSGQVSATAQTLSQGSTEQAAAGEEVSSAMEEMSATIRQSAESAATTEGLARKTAASAKEGGEAVIQAMAAMKQIAERIGIIDIVPDISRTAELIQEISMSAMEQTSGVAQIEKALLQLDQVIQQNASASEELASMSEELTGRTESMNEALGFFRIETSERGKTPAPVGRAASKGRTAPLEAEPRRAIIPVPDEADSDFETF